MKTNLKRVLSLVCALALCIGMLPMSALAAEPENTYSDKETAQKETGVTADKELKDNGDGTYTITLSVQGYTDESSETVELPADKDLLDLTFTVEATVPDAATNELGTQEVRIGKSHNLKTTHFEFASGIITGCEWEAAA